MKLNAALVVVLLLTVGFSAPVTTQTSSGKPVVAPQKPVSSTPPKPSPPITNDGVVRMVKAGLAEDLIMASIKNAAKRAFDLSPEGLIALQAAGVSDRIMRVMSGLEPDAPPAPPPTAAAAVAAPKVEPVAPPVATRDAGFYVVVGGGEIPIETSPITGGKVGTLAAVFSGGIAKAKMKAIVNGALSDVRVSPPMEFTFVAGNGLDNAKGLTIVRLTVEKGDRVFQVGEMGVTGGSSGMRDKDIVPFKVEKIGPNTFKLVLEAPLPAGEYAFVSAVMMQVTTASVSGKVWDFGVGR